MILDRFRLTDRVAVVTGAGRGIGAATALALAEAGADVVLSSRTESQLADVAKQVEAAGRRALVVPADLTDLDAVAALAPAAVDAFGRLDIVVNNVGGTMPREFVRTRRPATSTRPSTSTSPSPTRSTRAAVPLHARGRRRRPHRRDRQHLVGHGPGQRPRLPRLRHRQGGAVPLHPPARRATSPPGSGSTPSGSARWPPPPSSSCSPTTPPARRWRPTRRSGGSGEPEDIAATALFLASDAGAYVTGKVVDADGGLDQPNLDMGLPDL